MPAEPIKFRVIAPGTHVIVGPVNSPRAIAATATEINIKKGPLVYYLCRWFHEGSAIEGWFEEFLVTPERPDDSDRMGFKGRGKP